VTQNYKNMCDREGTGGLMTMHEMLELLGGQILSRGIIYRPPNQSSLIGKPTM